MGQAVAEAIEADLIGAVVSETAALDVGSRYVKKCLTGIVALLL